MACTADFFQYSLLVHRVWRAALQSPASYCLPSQRQAAVHAAGKVHWELLLRARAVETQCYVIAAAQAGKHNEKRESWGHSIIIDPWGTVVAELDDHSTGVLSLVGC